MDAQATESRSEYPARDPLVFIQPKSSELIVLPLVKVNDELSVPAEVMAGVWQQIVNEGKKDYLFYDGTVKDLQGWIEYIYSPRNYVVLVIDEKGHIYHIAWVNKFSAGQGFMHHCSLGPYNRRTWPTLQKYYRSLRHEDKPVVRVLMGVTPETNEKAVRLLSIIGWNILGTIPSICYLAKENKYVGGIVSYTVINEV